MEPDSARSGDHDPTVAGPDANGTDGPAPGADAPETPPRGQDDEPGGPDGDPGGPDNDPGGAGPRRDAVGSHTALTPRNPPGVPIRPPRRTGVFIDPEDLREHVGALLRAILGGHEVDAFGNFTFTYEDARVFVTVGGSPIGPQVGVFSVTNVDLDLSPELARFLLTTNHTLGFGAFSYEPGNRAVWLRHSLLGTALDLPELQSAVAAVATTAASLDHTIRDRFGGRTFQEAPGDVQRRVEPPSSNDGGHPNASGYL